MSRLTLLLSLVGVSLVGSGIYISLKKKIIDAELLAEKIRRELAEEIGQKYRKRILMLKVAVGGIATLYIASKVRGYYLQFVSSFRQIK
jgi:ADP-ribose pyrophosphatase YjhB (NUDIX family)